MPERLSRQELYELVWREPLRSLSARFGISDVALRKTCAKAQVPTPDRGHWAKKDAGQKLFKTPLPERPPAMEDEILVAGGKEYWYPQWSDKELLAPLPPPPIFQTPIETLRDRIAKTIGSVTVPREVRVWHPAIQRLLSEDQARREKQSTWSWDKPLFDTAADRRRLRLLNSLVGAIAKFNAKVSPEKDAKKTAIGFYRQHLAIMLAPPKRSRGNPTSGEKAHESELTFSILESFQSETEARSWSDTDDIKLERQLAEIATEIVLHAEVLYRKSVIRQYEWRVERKAQLEEEQRRRKLEAEDAERERIKRLEQTRIDRLLADAAALQQASVIRDYVEKIRSAQSAPPTVSREALERWSKWALAQADRIDPSLCERFLAGFVDEV